MGCLNFIGMFYADELKGTAENITHAFGQSQTETADFFIFTGSNRAFLIKTVECVTNINCVTGNNGGFHFINGGLRFVYTCKTCDYFHV